MSDLPCLRARALRYEAGELWVLDQRLLPWREHWVRCDGPAQMAELIRSLAVRGAPLIGIAAALSLADFARRGASGEDQERAARLLLSSRPTAVNLRHALARLRTAMRVGESPLAAAAALFEEDRRLCERLAARTAARIQPGERVLTHCNTGQLVTAGVGTALGGILQAHREGKGIRVVVGETRPLLQGARLTAWELADAGVPFELVCDSAVAALMARREIDRVLVGADRIARNGDVANKVGTYAIAVLARHHGVPFHVVAPRTTVDLACPSGDRIPIEERSALEVRSFPAPDGEFAPCAPPAAAARNPAFDVTPAELLTSLILEDAELDATSLARGGLTTPQ